MFYLINSNRLYVNFNLRNSNRLYVNFNLRNSNRFNGHGMTIFPCLSTLHSVRVFPI